MATLAFRQAAIDDLSDIYRYTVRIWSSMQADAYYHRIQVACNNLASGALRLRLTHPTRWEKI